MKAASFTAILLVLMGVLAIATLSASLTSCVGPQNVTCPPGSAPGNIGSCPNGFVLWGCKNTTTGLPIAGITLPNTTTSPTTVSPTTSIVSNGTPTAPTTVFIAPSSSSNILTILVIVIIIIIIVVAIYLAVRNKTKERK